MLAVQEKVLNLLVEIDNICRENNLEYSLTENAAVMALDSGKFKGNDYTAEIMMRAADYKKFAEQALKLDGKELETLENNSKLNGVYARYVDSNTTLWDLEKWNFCKKRGVFVLIRILRPGKKESGKDSRVDQVVRNNAREGLFNELVYGVGEYKKQTAKLMGARMVYGGASKAKELFKNALKDRGKSENLFYYAGGARRVFARADVNAYKDIEFEGKKLRIIDNTDALMKAIKGGDYDKKAYDVNGFPVIADLEMPYAEFAKWVAENGLYGSKEESEQKKFFAFEKRNYNKRLENTNTDLAYVRRSIMRMQLWERYGGREEEIKALYKTGDYDKLREELDEYIYGIEYFCDHKLGMCADKEIFEIACDVMEHDGKSKIVEKVRKMMPREFTEETVGEFLARQGYVE